MIYSKNFHRIWNKFVNVPLWRIRWIHVKFVKFHDFWDFVICTRWSVNAYNFFGPAENVPKWAAHEKSTCFLFLNWSQVSENKLSDALIDSPCVFLQNNIFFQAKKRPKFDRLDVFCCSVWFLAPTTIIWQPTNSQNPF